MKETNIYKKLRHMVNLTILRKLPPCKEIVQIVSASLDRKLTLREKAIMKLHLVACKPCARYFEQSQFLSLASHQLDENLKEDLFTGRLSDEARRRIKNILNASMGLFALLFII